MKRGVGKSRGFTIIELLLTIIIISVGLMGIMALFENATRGAGQADLNIIASTLARDKLEQVVSDKVAYGYANLNDTNYPDETFSSEFSPYSRNTAITEVAGNDLVTPEVGSGYKRVDVTVWWGAGGADRVIIPTVLADY